MLSGGCLFFNIFFLLNLILIIFRCQTETLLMVAMRGVGLKRVAYRRLGVRLDPIVGCCNALLRKIIKIIVFLGEHFHSTLRGIDSIPISPIRYHRAKRGCSLCFESAKVRKTTVPTTTALMTDASLRLIKNNFTAAVALIDFKNLMIAIAAAFLLSLPLGQHPTNPCNITWAAPALPTGTRHHTAIDV